MLLHIPNGVPVEQLSAEQAVQLCTTVPPAADGSPIATAKGRLQSAAAGLQVCQHVVCMHAAVHPASECWVS